MASWDEIAREIQQEFTTSGPNALDIVRRRKLTALYNHTHRPILLYAVDFFNNTKIKIAGGSNAISINLTDKDGFTEALNGISGKDLDLIVHSPGGYPEATESLVKLIRRRFTNIRCIVPSVAKSAATMLSMSANEIVLGIDAELGPTDPQMNINGSSHPAHAILKQFDLAKVDIGKSQNSLPAWIPILQQYGPALLINCRDAIRLSTTLVSEWLATYMFSGKTRSKNKASIVSRYLAGDKHLSHNRLIDIDQLKTKGVNIKFADEIDSTLPVLIQDLHYSVMQTFDNTGAYKFFENHLGKGLFKLVELVNLPPQQNPAQTVKPQPTRNSNPTRP